MKPISSSMRTALHQFALWSLCDYRRYFNLKPDTPVALTTWPPLSYTHITPLDMAGQRGMVGWVSVGCSAVRIELDIGFIYKKPKYPGELNAWTALHQFALILWRWVIPAERFPQECMCKCNDFYLAIPTELVVPSEIWLTIIGVTFTQSTYIHVLR